MSSETCAYRRQKVYLISRAPENGLVETNFGGVDRLASALTDEGRIVAVGTSDRGDTRAMVLVRYGAGLLSTGLTDRPQEEKRTVSASIYPNPARDKARLLVEGCSSGRVQLSLHDLLGRRLRILYVGLLVDDYYHWIIDVSHLAGGTYFVRIIGCPGVTTLPIVVAR